VRSRNGLAAEPSVASTREDPRLAPYLAGGAHASESVFLVRGELLLAEPLAVRLAEAMAAARGCPVELRRRPSELGSILADLRTYSLFGGGKVTLVVASAVFADRSAAADLLDEAAEVLPLAGRELGVREREAGSRLLQALRLFGQAAESAALANLPEWALQGGRAYRRAHGERGRGKKQIEELRSGLANLLERALEVGLQGFAEGDLAELGEVLDGGLPPGHALVLAESLAGDDHPLVARLRQRGTLLEVGTVEAERRGGWSGLDNVVDELATATEVGITPDALAELARRTLRRADSRGAGVDPEAVGRLGAEYRKLAAQVGRGGRISRRLVEENVADRGEEDVWQILDAVSDGKSAEALLRLRRLLEASDDPVAARLSFFSLFATYCRHLTAIGGLLAERGVPANVRAFDPFKNRWAPLLQQELAQGKNPLAGLHPFRLHRAYLAASRLDRRLLDELPWQVLETELQLKGETSDPDVALAALVARVAGAPR
jgi:hypothetical protein